MPPPSVSLAAFRDGDAEAATSFVDAMHCHGFVVFRGDDAEANGVLRNLVLSAAAFFQRKDKANHTQRANKTKAHGYPLWGTGYTHSFVGGASKLGREQFHVVVGAADDETPWPTDPSAIGREAHGAADPTPTPTPTPPASTTSTSVGDTHTTARATANVPPMPDTPSAPQPLPPPTDIATTPNTPHKPSGTRVADAPQQPPHPLSRSADNTARGSPGTSGSTAHAPPQPARPSFRDACAAGIELLEDVATCGLDLLIPAGSIRACLAATRSDHCDTSVLDVFNYTGADGDYGMGDHTDPGLLTILPAACTPALEVFDAESATWVAVERLCGTESLGAASRDVIIFGGFMLEELTQGAVRACRHLVAKCQQPRISAIYELRAAESAFVPLVRGNCGAAVPRKQEHEGMSQPDGLLGAGPLRTTGVSESGAARAHAIAGARDAEATRGAAVVAEQDRELTESEVQRHMRRLGLQH